MLALKRNKLYRKLSLWARSSELAASASSANDSEAPMARARENESGRDSRRNGGDSDERSAQGPKRAHSERILWHIFSFDTSYDYIHNVLLFNI